MADQTARTETVFHEGDRVRHRYVNLAGTVKRVNANYINVKWDHYGLAVAALGTMCDLQPPKMLEAVRHG